MKRHIFLILITLLLIATALKAGAEASKDENLSRYLGAWVSEEYRLYIRIEDDEVIARLTEVNGDYVWEFNRCFFDRDEGCLCGQNYVHYRQYIDWDVMELVQDDIMGGGETTTTYRSDVNLDRVFDEQDTLAGRGLNLCCLTSPVSFSCGNLVPWAFKADGRVKLLGSITGGGSCEVQPLTSAWGTSFVISGPVCISFLKNGSYYDVDQGVQPDYTIFSFDHYYDRNALAEFVNSLY